MLISDNDLDNILMKMHIILLRLKIIKNTKMK